MINAQLRRGTFMEFTQKRRYRGDTLDSLCDLMINQTPCRWCQLKDTLVIPKSVENHQVRNEVFNCRWRNMKILRNSLRLGKTADIVFPEYYDNNILIWMNLSSCKLSFNTLVSFLECTYAFLGRPRNFTKMEYA